MNGAWKEVGWVGGIWEGSCRTAAGCGCCLPGEMDSEGWEKDHKAAVLQMQRALYYCFQSTDLPELFTMFHAEVKTTVA